MNALSLLMSVVLCLVLVVEMGIMALTGKSILGLLVKRMYHQFRNRWYIVRLIMQRIRHRVRKQWLIMSFEIRRKRQSLLIRRWILVNRINFLRYEYLARRDTRRMNKLRKKLAKLE